MTAVDVAFYYGQPPSAATMRALDSTRDVYGIRRIQFNETEQVVRVEYDATRLTEAVVAALLRRAGLELKEKLSLV